MANCPPDFNADGSVGFTDLTTLLNNWGPCGDCANCTGDIDGDCAVGFSDLTDLLSAWGPCGFVYPEHDDAFANQVGLQALLDASGSLTLPQDQYDRISRDIALLQQERPELVGAPHNAPWKAYRMLVVTDPQASPATIQQTLDYYQAEVLGGLPNLLVLDFPKGINIPALVPVFEALDWVEAAEVDRVFGAPTPIPGWTPAPDTDGWWAWTVVAAWANGGICDETQSQCECATTYSFFTSAEGAVFVMDISTSPYTGGDCTGYPPAP
jgi:hypothetical protein